LTLTYTGTTLTVVIADTVTNVTATQAYTVNIPRLLAARWHMLGLPAAPEA